MLSLVRGGGVIVIAREEEVNSQFFYCNKKKGKSILLEDRGAMEEKDWDSEVWIYLKVSLH